MWRSRGLVECGAGSAERVVTAELLSTEDVADRGDELVGVVGRVDGRLPGSALVPTPGGSRGLDGLASGRARRSVVRVY